MHMSTACEQKLSQSFPSNFWHILPKTHLVFLNFIILLWMMRIGFHGIQLVCLVLTSLYMVKNNGELLYIQGSLFLLYDISKNHIYDD